MGGLPGWSDRPPGESRTNAGSSRRIRSPELTRLSRNRRLRVLANFVRLESIPADWREWRGEAAQPRAPPPTPPPREAAPHPFPPLATLRTDIALFDDVDELQWLGPEAGFETLGARLDAAVTGIRRPFRWALIKRVRPTLPREPKRGVIRQGRLSRPSFEEIEKLRKLRNRAVHGPECPWVGT